MPEWINIAWRSLVTLAVMLLLTRLLGRKQLSQMTFFHYVVGITAGSIAAFISTELEGNFMLGMTALIIWMLIPLALEWATLKSKRVRDWVEGKGMVLIKDGKVLEDNLKKVHLTSDELLEQLRSKNAFRVADVEFAVMEPNGKLSVLLRKENQPLTPKHLGVKVPNEQEPQTVIMDGNIMDEPLATIGLNREWLRAELDKLGVTLENVYLAQVDANKQLYVDLYDDNLKVPEPKQREQLWATLKKCAADLETFGLSTEDPEVKKMYEGCAMIMKNVLQQVEPFLKR